VVPGKKDLAGVDEFGVRASVLWEPSDGMKWVLRASTSLQTPTNYGIYAEPAAEVRAGLSTRQIAANIDKTRYARTQSFALTGTIDVGSNLTLTSITSYDKGILDFYEDTDGQSNQLLEVPYYDNASQVAQDLRLTSDFTGPFNFIVGAYFNRESVFNRSAFEIGKDIDSDGLPGVTDADCAIGLPLGCIFENQFNQKKKSFALYTDASYELSDALTLRGGLRFTDDKGEQTGFRSDALGPNRVLVVTLIPPTSLSYKKTNISGKIGLDYKLADDRLLYANFSRGYRANSFNAQAFFDPSEVSVAKPETVDAFEVGIKSQWADRRVTLNAAAFSYKYTNQQFLNIDPTTAAQTLLNLPESRITGAEVELTARASDAITLRAGLGLLDAKVKKGIVSGVDVKDRSLSNAPKMTFNGGIDADVWQDTSGSLSAHVDLAYSSSQYFEVINVPRLQQGSYTLLNAHLDWESADGKWTAAVWGKNLADKFYHTSRVDLLAGFGFDYSHIGAPRTFGISAGMKF
jgi:iron complex outermembrane receptor protein